MDPSEFRPENDQLIIPSNGRFSLKANQKETNHDFLFFQNKVLCLFSQTDCFMDFSTKTPSHLTSLSSWNLESGEMWNVDFKSATTPSTPSTAFNQLPKDKTATQQGLWREGTVQLGIFLKSAKNTKRIIWIYRTFEWTSQLFTAFNRSFQNIKKTHKKRKMFETNFSENRKTIHFRGQNTTHLRAVGQVQGAACRTLQRIYANLLCDMKRLFIHMM